MLVWNKKWNGMEISVWNMEDARMEWNGRQSSILPYQFHIRFVDCTVFTEKCVPMSGSDK